MKRLVLFALMAVGVAFAQNTTVNPTAGTIGVTSSGNVLNLGGGLPWNNTVTGAAGGYSGGYTPAYNPSTGNIIFGYTPQTVSQTVQLNQALASAGSGIQVSGYYYSWGINNDLNNGGGNRGTISGNVTLSGPTGNTLESYNYNYSQINTGGNFQTFSGTQMFSNQYQLNQASTIKVSFTGKDQNYWAGFYGPRVHVNEFDVLYSVNPCAQNPAYSSTCSGFSSLYTSPNLVPNPTAVATPGNIVDNSFAISTALSNNGSGLSLYGINYGFTYNLPTTASSGSVSVGTSDILNTTSNGKTYQLNGPSQGEQIASYHLLTPSAVNTNTLGNFKFVASVQGEGSYISNMNASLIVMPDACTTNPLSSTSCTGYAAAYAKQMSQNAVNTAISNSTTNTNSVVALASQVVAAPPPAAPQPVAQNTVSDTNPVTTSATSSAPIGSVSIAPTVVSAPAPPAAASPAPAASNSNSSGGSSTATASTSGSPASVAQSGGPAKESSGNGTSIGLSVVAKNQQQNQAVAMTAAANATAQAQQAGTSAQQTALSVAATAASNAVASSQAVVRSGPTGPSGASGSSASNSNNSYGQGMASGATVMSAMGPTTTTSQKQDQSGSSSSTTQTVSSQTFTGGSTQTNMMSSGTTVAMVAPTQTQTVTSSLPMTYNNQQTVQSVNVQQNVTNNIVEQQYNTTNPLYSLLPPVQTTIQPYTPPVISNDVTLTSVPPTYYQPQQTVTQSSSVVALLPPSPVLDRFGPINQVLEAKVTVPTTNTTVETGPVVNKNAQNNEAAGKVDINRMAQTPTGYGNYLNIALKDASFYAPKEVYKNQKTVDNVRALRQLANDNKHRELVELQYVR